jgi:Ni/Co efflux regulator RcnB
MVSQGGPMLPSPHGATMINGRWAGGYQAPGGWAAYRRPAVGFVLPGYWMQPAYYIADYDWYGLPAPAAGYGWSRYYDDAVLTDRYGNVQDVRVGYDWDRRGDYAPGPRDLRDGRRSNGGRALGGAAIGGVTGGLLGSAIAGPGGRVGGAILGAGIGAIAGAVLGEATSDREARPDGSTLGARDDKIAREEARQQRKLDKLAREAGYASYDDYLRIRNRDLMAHAPHGGQPHWAARGGPESGFTPAAPGQPHVETRQMPGYVAGGYYYPGATITTVTFMPSVTTTTRTYVTRERTVTRVKARPASGSKIIRR